MKKNYIGKALIIIFALLVTAFVFKWIRTIAFNNGVATVIGVADDGHGLLEVTDGIVLNQEFVNDISTIKGVSLKFNVTPPINEGGITVELLDASTDQILASCYQPYEMISDNFYTTFDMGGVSGDIVGKTLNIRVTIHGIQPGQLVIYAETAGDFSARILPVGRDNFCVLIDVVFGLLMAIILIVMCCVLFCKSFKVENVFLFLSLSLGLLMTLLIPAMSVPDEQYHMHAAYRLSNHMLGIQSEQDGFLMMRYCDDQAMLINEDLERAYYNWYYDEMFQNVDNAQVVNTGNYETHNTPYLYLVPALGLTIGRMCGFNTILTYLIGKWMNLLLFSIATFYAIKRMPFAKTMVAVWALFPIVMQQAGSFSYDCGIYALTSLVICLTMRFMYGDSYQSKKWKYIDMALLGLCAILLAPCKSFGIIPIAILPIMLLAKFLWNRRSEIKKYFIQKKYRIVAFTVAVVTVLAALSVALLSVIRALLQTADGHGHYLAYVDQYAYPIGHFLKHPVDFVLKLWTTLWLRGDDYLGQMIGSSLGWLEIEVPWMFIIPFFALFLLAGIRKSDENQPIGLVSKLWMVALFVGVCFIACVGMLLYWTPMSSIDIIGVQGRYFLPGLILMGLSLRTKRINTDAGVDKGILCAIPVLYTFIAAAILDYML